MICFCTSNDDFNGFFIFAFFFEVKGYFKYKNYTVILKLKILKVKTLKYKRNRIFHPCRNMFDFTDRSSSLSSYM